MRFCLIILFAIGSICCFAQEQNNQGHIEDFIPSELEILDTNESDINEDGTPDAIVVCYIDGSDVRPVFVFFGIDNGKYILKGSNDNIADEHYVNIAVTRNYFTIENRAGTQANYSMLNHTFKVVKNDILFHRYDDIVYEVIDWDEEPEMNHMTTIRAAEFGNPTFITYRK
ncbi:hypothetical protein C9994_10440 [Marivirga lumbricoides]|uniref:Uncharacterized protein n=1 Tax=Marivirga lumbricoides TaxID=1046115 RepID=A0A2T4DPI0_9BACT|nr:hypothetical protein C9994_10440 [Marivirga lumbricoides]